MACVSVSAPSSAPLPPGRCAGQPLPPPHSDRTRLLSRAQVQVRLYELKQCRASLPPLHTHRTSLLSQAQVQVRLYELTQCRAWLPPLHSHHTSLLSRAQVQVRLNELTTMGQWPHLYTVPTHVQSYRYCDLKTRCVIQRRV